MSKSQLLSVKGALFQPRQARAQSCTLLLGPEGMSFKEKRLKTPENFALESFQDRKHFHFTSGHYFIADEPITPSQAQNYLYLYEFTGPDKKQATKPSAIKETTARTFRFLNALENLNAAKITILVIFFFACLVGFRYAWPYATKPIVAVIPHHIDVSIGKNTYKSLRGTLFNDTKLPQEQIDRLTKRAYQMAEKANLAFRPKIYFHSSPLGANAMALPGGPIVVTDGLVKLLKDDALILAVIGHEYGHVEERHSMQQIVHLAGITAVASLIFGADESILEEVAGIAITSWAFKNRRIHEYAADLFSVNFFRTNNMDPALMIKVMDTLTDYGCGAIDASGKPSKEQQKDKTTAEKIEACKNADTGWFSTHPSGLERIKALEAAIEARP